MLWSVSVFKTKQNRRELKNSLEHFWKVPLRGKWLNTMTTLLRITCLQLPSAQERALSAQPGASLPPALNAGVLPAGIRAEGKPVGTATGMWGVEVSVTDCGCTIIHKGGIRPQTPSLSCLINFFPLYPFFSFFFSDDDIRFFLGMGVSVIVLSVVLVILMLKKSARKRYHLCHIFSLISNSCFSSRIL